MAELAKKYSPEQSHGLQEGGQYWINGPFLVMRTNAALPDRCVKCNRPASKFVRKRLLWADTPTESRKGLIRHIEAVKVFFAFRNMFLWLGSLRTLQIPAVSVGLCSRHLIKSRLLTLIGYLALPLSCLIFLVHRGAANISDDELVLLHLWLPIAGLAVSGFALSRPRPVKAIHIGVDHATLAGVGSPFLNSIAIPSVAVVPSRVEDIAASTATLKQVMAAKKAGQSEGRS